MQHNTICCFCREQSKQIYDKFSLPYFITFNFMEKNEFLLHCNKYPLQHTACLFSWGEENMKKERKWFLFCWWKEEIIVYLQLKNHKNENLLMWFHQNVPYSNGAQYSIYCAIGRIYVKCGNSWKTWLSEIFRL